MQFRRLMLASLLAGASLPTLSHAQTAPVAEGNEEVVVTANRRAQAAQDVGIALTAVTGATLSERGITTVNGLENITPSLEIENQFGSGQVGFSIRGIGFRDYASNNSATVGLYVDDVAYALPILSQGVLFDIDRVEVLRGPQGTLYGRNSTGGAINVISKKPSAEQSAGFVAEYGRFGAFHGEGYFNAAIAEGVNARVSAATEQGGAWQKNRETGEELGDADKTAARLLLDIAPEGSPVTVLLNVHGYRDKGDGVGKQLFTNFLGSFPGTDYGAAPALAHHGRETSWGTSARYAEYVGIATDTKPFRDNEGWGTSATVGADLGFAQLTYIGAYEHLDRREYNDFDALTDGFADVYFVSDVSEQSHELRLASDSSGPLTWVTGAYYAKEKLSELYTSGFSASNTPPFALLLTPYKQKVETIGFFGQAEYAVTDELNLVGGLRWEHEARFLYDAGTFAPYFNPDFNFANSTVDGTLEERSTEFNQVTGKVAVEYTPTEGLLTYASVSRGIKSGGFTGYNSFNPAALNPFKPEELWAYEVGFKGDFADNTFRLNGAAFYYDYSDQQVQTAIWVDLDGPTGPNTGTPVGKIGNAPESEVYGFELEAVWKITPEFTLTQAVGWKQGTFQEFLDLNAAASAAAQAPVYRDRSGEDIGFPELSYSGSLTYDGSTDMGFSYTASVDYSYRDEQKFPLLGDDFTIESYWLFNANLMFHPDNSPWEIGFWGRNIFNEHYDETRNTFQLDASQDFFAVPGRPATYGIRIGMQL